MLRRRHAPLLLAAAAGAALAATPAVSPSGDGRGVPSALHGVARSSRALYTVCPNREMLLLTIPLASQRLLLLSFCRLVVSDWLRGGGLQVLAAGAGSWIG